MKRAANHRKTDGQHPALTRVTTAGQAGRIRNPTTSFLTAATLIYAIGAGITAAAGHSYYRSSYILMRSFPTRGIDPAPKLV